MHQEKDIKKEIIKTGKKLYKKGFVPGMSGNISLKDRDVIYITVTGSCLGHMEENEIITIDINGNLPEYSNSKPSSEYKMHLEIYKARPEINCIIHAHPPYSTAFSISGISPDLPLIAEPIVLLGDIKLVNYKLPSSTDLAKEVAEGFKASDAVLMQNHGAAVCGKTLKDTYYKLETLEFYSQINMLTINIENKSILSSEQVKELENLRNLIKS